MTTPASPHPEGGGFSDESLEDFLAGTAFDTSNLNQQTDPPADDNLTDDSNVLGGDEGLSPDPASGITTQGSGSDDDDTQGGVTSPTTTSSSDSTPALEWDDGLTLSRDQARALAEFDAFLEANPELAQQIAGVVQGQYQLVPLGGGEPQGVLTPPTPATSPTQSQPQPPLPTTPPADLDLDDPQIKLLWETLQQQTALLQQQQQRLTTHESQLGAQTQATTQSLINKAEQTFKTSRTLNDEQMAKIKEVAGRLNVLPSLLSPIDPVTQLPRNVDPIAAIEQAFDIAYWQMPEFRNRQVQATVQQTIQDNTRKSKASSVSGNSGSVRRTPVTKPQTKEERKQAMIREVAGMMTGESQGEN